MVPNAVRPIQHHRINKQGHFDVLKERVLAGAGLLGDSAEASREWRQRPFRTRRIHRAIIDDKVSIPRILLLPAIEAAGLEVTVVHQRRHTEPPG